MRVFLDTSVLVSAFATRGLSADVLREVLADHELCTGEVVLEELQRVLSEKLGLPEAIRREMVDLVRRGHVEPKPAAPPQFAFSLRDADDAWVLAAAAASRADVLVTGDGDLLEIKDLVSNLLIIDPRGFWNLLRERREHDSQ